MATPKRNGANRAESQVREPCRLKYSTILGQWRMDFPPDSVGFPSLSTATVEPRDPPHYDTLLGTLARYKSAYLNYAAVVSHILTRRFPFKARLRNGDEVELSDHAQAYNCSVYTLLGWSVDPQSDTVVIPAHSGRPPLVFLGAFHDGALKEVYVEEEYTFLDVHDRTVIDIGASIGDSAIYFALRGAREVIGLEPFPKTYSYAVENVKRNSLSSRVKILRAACQTSDGHIQLNEHLMGTGGLSATENPGGHFTEALSLQSIVNRFNVHSGVLKVDCEGDEYAIFDSVDNETLRAFDQIMIEYHFGLKQLVDRLLSAGFLVRYTKPRRTRDHNNGKILHQGLIRATASRGSSEPTSTQR